MTSPDKYSDTGEPLVLVLSADERFLVGLSVAVFSALVHLRQDLPVVLYILDAGINKTSKTRIEQLARRAHNNVDVRFLAFDLSLFKDVTLPESKRFHSSVFMRLYIPELLPVRFKRAIYMDCDMVVESDLEPLWMSELGNHAILAVRERYIGSDYGVHNWRELELDPEGAYFNCGFMVMNLEVWRLEGIAQQVFDYLDRYGAQVKMAEQEGLNAVLAGRCGLIDVRWNLIAAFYENLRFDRYDLRDEYVEIRSELLEKPSVIHYNAPLKPWHFSCYHPARIRFFHYLKRSGLMNSLEYAGWASPRWLFQLAAEIGHRARYRGKWMKKQANELVELRRSAELA